jgi:hypothetical protein
MKRILFALALLAACPSIALAHGVIEIPWYLWPVVIIAMPFI